MPAGRSYYLAAIQIGVRKSESIKTRSTCPINGRVFAKAQCEEVSSSMDKFL